MGVEEHAVPDLPMMLVNLVRANSTPRQLCLHHLHGIWPHGVAKHGNAVEQLFLLHLLYVGEELLRPRFHDFHLSGINYNVAIKKLAKKFLPYNNWRLMQSFSATPFGSLIGQRPFKFIFIRSLSSGL